MAPKKTKIVASNIVLGSHRPAVADNKDLVTSLSSVSRLLRSKVLLIMLKAPVLDVIASAPYIWPSIV